MKSLKTVALIFGIISFAIGVLAVLSGGGVEHVVLLGQTLIIAGAILLAATVVSSAIADRDNRGPR